MAKTEAGITLAEFLRSCRARVSPDAGIHDARRRVPGLRREELAQLAGVSVDYYTRLEQGRSKSASPQVLDALAVALRLSEVERGFLLQLARPDPGRARRRRPAAPQHVDQATRDLLAILDGAYSPAFVIGRRQQVLAHNRLAGALIADFQSMPVPERNLARFVFLEEDAHALYPDWSIVASNIAAMLRLDAGLHPDDPDLEALVGELSIKSTEFRRVWAERQVHQHTTGTKRYHHPVVGDLTVSYQVLIAAHDQEQTLFIYRTPPDSPSRTALQLLASWINSPSHWSEAEGLPAGTGHESSQPNAPSGQ